VWAFGVEEGNLQATGFHMEGVQGLGRIKWADWSRKGKRISSKHFPFS